MQSSILHEVLCIWVKQGGWQYTSLVYSFPNLEPVCCSMSSSNCCFFTWIEISQEAGQVVCYSHLLKNFLQFVVIHTVKDFSIVNKAEVDVFLKHSCFLMIQWMLAIWYPVPMPFLNTAWTPGSSQFAYCWNWLGEFWALFYYCVRWVQLCGSLSIFWHCLSLGLEWKLTFSVLWPLLSFPNVLHTSTIY